MAVALFPSSQFLVSPNKFSSPSSLNGSTNNSSTRLGNKPHHRITASAAGGAATAEKPRSTAFQYMSFSCAPTLYQDLGISMGASFQEIKNAYRKLARTCHPDVVSDDRKDISAGYFMKIHAAYSTLSDPQKRMDYDRKLFKRPQPKSSPFSFTSSPVYATASGYTRTNSWETDQCW